MFYGETYSELINNDEDRRASLSEGALNAFPTFGSKTRDWRILAGGILKCFSQENMGQNIVRSGMTLHQQVILSLKTFIEANLNRVESGQLFIWLYVSIVESPDLSLLRWLHILLTFWIFNATTNFSLFWNEIKQSFL